MKLGFKVVPYDYDGDCKPPQNCQNERERGQAQNVYDRILRENPKAKILVYAGMGHIQERESKQITIMAAHFKNISKIDPFTIDQIEINEHSSPEYEFPDYRYAAKKQLINKPTIFQSAKGDYWLNKSGLFTTVNAQIFHPRVTYVKNRPAWLQTNGTRKGTEIDSSKLNLPIQNKQFAGTEMLLVQAFFAGEESDAVPVDQFIIYPGKDIPALMLPKGKYRIRAIDKSGKIIGEYQK